MEIFTKLIAINSKKQTRKSFLMAHDLQQSMVVRSDYYVPPEMVGQIVAGRGSSVLSGAPTYTQKRIVAPPPPPSMKDSKRRKSKAYFVCTVPECKEKFSCAENLETHMKLHQGIKPFTCNICGKVCRTESRLNIHQARHASDGENCKCDICERSFSSRSALKKHKLRIHRPLPHICPYCHSGFEEDRYMAIHIKRAHEIDPALQTNEPEPSTLQVNSETNNVCAQQKLEDAKNYCKDSYITNADGGESMQPTSATSPLFGCQKEQKLSSCAANNTQRKAQLVSPSFTCEMCTSTFPSVSYLEQHMAVHVNEKSLTCQHCDMKFTNHQLLSNHLKLHNFDPETVSAFPPNFTNGSFAQYVPLSGQPTVTRGPQVVGKYICALCSEQFLNLGSLKRHQAKGHNSVDLSI